MANILIFGSGGKKGTTVQTSPQNVTTFMPQDHIEIRDYTAGTIHFYSISSVGQVSGFHITRGDLPAFITLLQTL